MITTFLIVLIINAIVHTWFYFARKYADKEEE